MDDIKQLKKVIKAQATLLACFRLNKQPPEWVFRVLEEYQKELDGENL